MAGASERVRLKASPAAFRPASPPAPGPSVRPLRLLPPLLALLAAPARAIDPVGAPPAPAARVSRLGGFQADMAPHGPVSGTLWDRAPSVAPGAPPGPTPPLAAVRAHLEDGDVRRALHDAERIAEERRWGRERTLASFVAGLLYREQGLHNLASESFTRVRLSGGALAPWGAYYEAEQDHRRGKPWVAYRECETLREADPGGRFDAACQRLMARALVAAGRTAKAREVADAHDEEHPDDAIREQIDLAIARRWSTSHPEWAIPLLRDLAVDHEAPLTGRVAEALLERLAAEGHEGAAVPDDVASLMRRAVSLRDGKRKDAAWALFEDLVARSADDPTVAAWVEREATTFAWRTHRWDALATLYASEHQETGHPDDAWKHYQALTRGGRFAEGLTVALEAQRAHPRHRRWRRSEEVVGRTAMLAGEYAAARDQFDVQAERGGWTGRRGWLYGGFAAHLAGDHEGAVERLDKVIARDRGYVENARYWRAEALEALGQHDRAEADRAAILRDDPRGWYALLLRQRHVERAGPPWDRTGRWAGPPPPDPAPQPPLARIADEIPVSPLPRPRVLEPDLSPWAALTWPLKAASATRLELAVHDSDAFHPVGLPPASYRRTSLFDPDEGRAALGRLARRHGEAWPEWSAIHDLAEAGLYDLSGPLLSEVHETWREAWRDPRHPLHPEARRISARGADWRPLFYAARDHHHADRYTFGMWDEIPDPALSREARRLGWPLAHDRYVWTHAREHDVDPYLVMAIMRVESRYDAIAVSRVGARGAMQIMPRTGRLIADLEGDEDFLTGDLEDPVFAVGYGIIYLGRLLDRFGGAFPLAVASYNGGPFNVSSWLEGTGREMPMDRLVEHIPFRETRRYVRSVSAAYETYLELYADPGARLVLPRGPYRDDPAVVDF